MKLSGYQCNWCGKKFDRTIGLSEPLSITHSFSYNSSHDTEELELDLCPECADKLTDYIVSQCTISCISDRWQCDGDNIE